MSVTESCTTSDSRAVVGVLAHHKLACVGVQSKERVVLSSAPCPGLVSDIPVVVVVHIHLPQRGGHFLTLHDETQVFMLPILIVQDDR